MAIRVKNWRQFQHYKDRDPKWIKLYRSWLDDAEFHRLPVASRALAPMLWLLASNSLAGIIDLSIKDIAWKLRQDESEVLEAIKPLIEKGFFVVEQDDSNSLADCNKDASNPLATCLPREEKRRDRGEKSDRSDLVLKIWQTYPTNKHRRDELQAPRLDAEAILNALAKDGDKVLVGVQAYRKATDTWPTDERKYIRKLDVFMQGRDYLKDPSEWQSKASGLIQKVKGQKPHYLTAEELEKKEAMAGHIDISDFQIVKFKK